MTTSVFGSARKSTVSIFDMITEITTPVTQGMETLNLGMDMLHDKVRVAHAASTQNTDAKIASAKELDLVELTRSHSETMLEVQRDLNKDEELAEMFAVNLKRFKELGAK